MINFFELKLIDFLNFSQDSFWLADSDDQFGKTSMINIFEGIYLCNRIVVGTFWRDVKLWHREFFISGK